MNLGGYFSLKVSRSGLEVLFWVLSKFPFAHLRGCTLSLFYCHSLQYPGCYSRGCRPGLGFGWFLSQANISTSTLSWNSGEHSDVKVWKNFACFFVWDFNYKFGLVWSYSNGFAYNFLGEALSYCPRLEFYFNVSVPYLHLKCVGIEQLFVFPLSCRLAFFNSLFLFKLHSCYFLPCVLPHSL